MRGHDRRISDRAGVCAPGSHPARAWPLSTVSALGAAFTLAFAVPAMAAAQEYQVDLDAERVVRFISTAAVHEFEGVTDRIDGFVILGEGGLEAGAVDHTEFYLEVDLGSLDTGIGLRNRQMRDNYLETHLFPYAVFSGSIVDVSMQAAGRISARGVGEMEIHGVSRPMQVTCEVTRSGERYRAGCEFGVVLSDFDIEIPNVMFLKLANDIRVELDFWVAPSGSGEEAA